MFKNIFNFNFVSIFLFSFILSTSAQAGLITNAYEVHEGNLYRSAQLSKRQFKRYIKKWKIKTIINLRGQSEKKWYRKELEAAKEMGVEHFDIKMSAKRLPHREDLLRLIELYETAPRPILIHCQGGADRTGEASAMYKLDFMDASKKEAMKMQTIKYFHLKKRYPAKRYFIGEIYQGKEWAKDNYYPCDGKYQHYDVNNPHCL